MGLGILGYPYRPRARTDEPAPSACRRLQTENCAPRACRGARSGRAGAPRPTRGVQRQCSPRHLEIVPFNEARLEEWQLVGALLETEAVLGPLHHVRGEPVCIVGVWKIAPHEWATAFLALKRAMNDQLARIDHVHGVDRIEPLVVDVSGGPFDSHARQ